MKLLKILGQVRHLIGVIGTAAVTIGGLEPSTAEVINTAGDAVSSTVDVIAAGGDIGFKEFAGALGVVVAFLWSWFAPEKKLA